MPLILDVFLRAVITIAAIVALTRMRGLRSFSKMSGFDFAITVSIGSILAAAVTTRDTDVAVYLIALTALFTIQVILSRSRIRIPFVKDTLDNAPLLVMENGEMLPENMRKAGMSEGDLWAKLREANAYDLAQVRAVVMETTGDVSVLHGQTTSISPQVMQDVERGRAS